MYSNDDNNNNKVIIERKKSLFTKIFSPRKNSSSKKDGVKYIVSLPTNNTVPIKQDSQNSFISTGEYFTSSNTSYTRIPHEETIDIIASQSPSSSTLYSNSVEISHHNTDSVAEKKTTSSRNSSSQQNKKAASRSNSYYVNSLVVYKTTRSHEHLKNYLKSLAHSRKNTKTFISVTSTTTIPANINSISSPVPVRENSLPNISNISNVSSTYSIPSPTQISQTQLNTLETSKEKKEEPSHKTHSDRKLALDKIITKLRKVQNQQNQSEQENEKKSGKLIDRPTKSKSKSSNNESSKGININLNKYFSNNGNKGRNSKYINQTRTNTQYSKSNPSNLIHSLTIPSTVSFSSKGHEMIPRHKNISVHSNYSKIASIDISNTQLNDEKYYGINRSSSTQHMSCPPYNIKSSPSSSNFEMNFNSDDTLINSQYLSPNSITDGCNSIKKSNSSITNTQEQIIELENTLSNLNLNAISNYNNSKPASNKSHNISSSSSRTQSNINLHAFNKPKCASRNQSNVNFQTQNTPSKPKAIEFRKPKGSTYSPNHITSSERELSRSPESIENFNTYSPPSNHYTKSVTYESSVNNKSDKGSISVSFALSKKPRRRGRGIGAFSLKNYVATETIEENSDEESWNEKFEVENDTISTDFTRKPKSLCNESVFSYSSSVNQIRNDLKMEKYKTKKKYFNNLLCKDREFFIREKLRKKIEELNSENSKLNVKNNNSRKASSSYSHSIKETDSIYVKSEEPNNVSLPSLHCMTEGKVNQYHFIKEIDSGAYGRVYMVYDENINKYFACKVVSKSRLKRNFRFVQLAGRKSGGSSENDPLDQIKREVAIFKKMTKHPNIASLVEVLDDAKEDNIYMVFELCEKGKIMDIKVNERVEPFTEDKARKYFRDIVLGLEYCHYKKIIHRDIKPENLLLTANDKVKISDFGISYMFNDNQDDANIFDKNASPLFCPP